MRNFSKVSPALWRSKRFRALPSSDAKLVLCYLLTCEHQNSAGCFRLPDEYAAYDLGWDIGRYIKARDEVASAQLIRLDPETEEVFVEGWFRFNPPMNTKHGKGTEVAIERIESDALQQHVLNAYRQTAQQKEASKTYEADFAQHSSLTDTRYLNRGRK